MKKMGNFKGLPVFMVTDPFEWEMTKNTIAKEERIFVYRTNVYYKNNRIAAIDGDILLDFDEDLFNELRRKSWDDDGAERLANLTKSAEVAPQSAPKPEKKNENSNDETVEPAAADIFMKEWQRNIDGEIERLNQTIETIGDNLNAVG